MMKQDFLITVLAITLSIVSTFLSSSLISAERTNQPKVLIVGSGINAASTTFFLQSLMQEEWRFCCIAQNLKGVPTMFDKLKLFWENRTTTETNNNNNNEIDRKYVYDCEHVSCDTDDDNAVSFTVVEKDSKIGGRVQAYQQDEGEPVIELGASVYHRVNHYFSYFAEDLLISQENEENKNRRDFERIESLRTHPYQSAKVGVWREQGGEGFIFKEHASFKAKTIFDVLWRYKLDPHYVSKCVETAVKNLDRIYTGQILKRRAFKTAEELLEKIDLLPLTRINMTKYFAECAGIKEDSIFLQELAQAFTKINYGQGLELSALAGSVALYGRGDDVFGVKDGNHRVIEALFRASNVSPKKKNLIINTEVNIEKNKETKQTFVIFKDLESNRVTKNFNLDDSDYDAVILAYPYWKKKKNEEGKEDLLKNDVGNNNDQQQQSQKKEIRPRNALEGKITHATIVRASGCWNYSAFGVSSQEEMPTVVCSNSINNNNDGKDSNNNKPTLTFFRSIGRLRGDNVNNNENKDCTFKVFSDEKISVKGQLDRVLQGDKIEILSAKEWNAAYPVLTPTKENNIDHDETAVKKTHSFILSKTKKFKKPILYAGALEHAVSTMETQTISGMNTALLLRELWGGFKLSKDTQKKLREKKKAQNEKEAEKDILDLTVEDL